MAGIHCEYPHSAPFGLDKLERVCYNTLGHASMLPRFLAPARLLNQAYPSSSLRHPLGNFAM